MASETKKIYNRQHSRKLPQTIQRIAMRKLWVLDAATEINELRVPPSNRLEVLRGNRKGQHSIRINQQWRICFRWRSGDVCDVEIVDYHYVPEINRKDVRELIYGNYRIIYRTDKKVISILTVRHSKQILPIKDIDDA